MKPLGLLLVIATTLFPAFQLFSLPNVTDKVALFSQYLGLAALILMSWGQLLATRLVGIEAVFGGLDRVYILHKWAGIIAMAAVLLHDTIDAEMRGLGPETALSELAETLGEISLYGLLILVVISVATVIPYHLWRWTHKAMGALFAAGTFHFFFITKPFAMNDPAGLYSGVFCVIGLAAYCWMLLPERLRPSHGYTIAKLERTGGALAITCKPVGKGLKALPGQFGIFRFVGPGTNEAHPFSFSKIGHDGSLRITVKALGDYTQTLQTSLNERQPLRIQGPFGRFHLSGRRPEIWIAGGIGITPFLAWAEALPADAPEVHLFFCVKSREDAPHLSELEAVVKEKQNLYLHIISSANGQRLSPSVLAGCVPSDLSETRVSFCGPLSLRRTMQSGLSRYGLRSKNFHFEEFEFRTGIGLKSLAEWILNRQSATPPKRR